MDTIVALSSGRPPAAIAVLRVSGPAAFAAAVSLAGALPPPRRASLRALRDAGGALLDRALVLIFPGPDSATGEDVVELHCHGGRAVAAAVEAALLVHPGVRVAMPGEFTRRALGNARIDLAQAEGLADLLEAETEGQRRAAMTASEGVVSRTIGGWLQALADLSARVEATIDHAEEGDVEREAEMVTSVHSDASALRTAILSVLQAPPVERVRDGIRVVIGGPPNSGKSTLLNLLSQRDAAIVSPHAGTTRDRVEAAVQRNGAAYLLIDTAGLTEAADPVERIGVFRAGEAIAAADLLVWLADTPPPRADALWVHARADLAGRRSMPIGPSITLSRDDPHSIERLWAAIESKAARLLPRSDDLPLKAVQRAACDAAAHQLSLSRDSLIAAEQLRVARHSLGAVLGVDATEAMLDALFGRFCLGK
ncbi:tRNA uridine-5-carboxymethylaminomethyl(34) synthesis GTPase MnmE [Sphingomonas sp.]|jgi:tRNA modification GTPase|uniref:tRNA uridine-5-carboxymethylaminomethyl(34) synthesis GTPase MnmE n=1 Tax=Sphingomonas sp. TaxID=28214 RepID=UPI002D7F01F1|nr:tRNA uridine-5-carboxymethylaminomethyl(34) synthesis GTPase MnmE [Sphingomonas sp.]HEU0045516.1 tRNA uridine-5-carboxymethylaminomethyl(34) synthesis GTPase MnmE [Sphingomonas sp.]